MIKLTAYKKNETDRYKLILLDPASIKCIEELEDVQGCKITLHSLNNGHYEYKVVQSLFTIESLLKQSALKQLVKYHEEQKTEDDLEYDFLPAEQLDISKNTLHKFKELGFSSTQAIFNALNTYDLLTNGSGIGKRTLTEIRDALDKAGYSLTNIV